MTEDNLSISLTDTIAKSELTSVGGELGEVAIDTLMEDGVLKDIPIIGTVTGLWKVGVTVRDAFFVKKLLIYLNCLADIAIDKRAEMLALLDDKNSSENVGEKIITLIDRLDSSSKAKIMGNAFKLYFTETITRDELWRVAFIVERLPYSDIAALIEWESTPLGKVEHIRKHLYLTVGLGWFVLDFSSTGFQWQERICSIFSNHLLCISDRDV